MPPKSAPDEASANTDVKILIELMHSATEFKADTSQMAAICGLSAAKNVYVMPTALFSIAILTVS